MQHSMNTTNRKAKNSKLAHLKEKFHSLGILTSIKSVNVNHKIPHRTLLIMILKYGKVDRHKFKCFNGFSIWSERWMFFFLLLNVAMYAKLMYLFVQTFKYIIGLSVLSTFVFSCYSVSCKPQAQGFICMLNKKSNILPFQMDDDALAKLVSSDQHFFTS